MFYGLKGERPYSLHLNFPQTYHTTFIRCFYICCTFVYKSVLNKTFTPFKYTFWCLNKYLFSASRLNFTWRLNFTYTVLYPLFFGYATHKTLSKCPLKKTNIAWFFVKFSHNQWLNLNFEYISCAKNIKNYDFSTILLQIIYTTIMKNITHAFLCM